MQESFFKIELEPLTPEEVALNAKAIRVATHFNASEKSLLEVIIEVDRSGFYRKMNYAYLTTYCREVLHLSDSTAAQHVTVARKSAAVPELAQAVADGKVSVPTAVQFTGVVTKQNCADWVDKAETLTKNELEKEVVKASPRARKTSAKPVADGFVQVSFVVTTEEWAKLQRLQDLESQRISESATIAQTVVHAVEESLERCDPVRKAERSKKKAESKPTYKNGTRTPIPAAVRHAVNRRDRGCCQAQGPDARKCASTKYVDLHHIFEVADGGKHEAENIVTLCGYHHRMLHRAELRTLAIATILGNSHGVAFVVDPAREIFANSRTRAPRARAQRRALTPRHAPAQRPPQLALLARAQARAVARFYEARR